MTLEDLKRDFLDHLEIEKGRSLKTRANYSHYLDKFLFFAKLKNPADISEDLIREYRLWLNRQSDGKAGTLKKRTQNYYLIALRAFLKYLAKRKVSSLSPDVIELAKVPERSLDLIGADDLKKLRDKAILELFFSTGLRVSELCSLSRDLDLRKDEFSIRGKGEKVRVVFLSNEAKEAIKKYLDKRVDVED